ncbi:MAG TPA: cytochrome c oxidase assembly protein [Anaeromyxobacter sp.]
MRTFARPLFALGPLALLPASALAQAAGKHAPPAPPGGWSADPLVLVPVAAAGLLYAAGHAALRLRGRGGTLRYLEAAAFLGGLAAVLVALVSPVDHVSERFFSVHAGQHELLMLVAAPLLVLGRPLAPFLAALPPRWQARALAGVRRDGVLRVWAFLTAPLVAVVLHAAARWAWHLPALFDAALASRPVHALQHASFFLTAVFFWWSVVHGRYGRAGCGSAVTAVFATAAHTGLLGAIVARSPLPFYRTYVALLGPPALHDQAVAGLVMAVPAGALFTLVGLALLAERTGEGARSLVHLKSSDRIP